MSLDTKLEKRIVFFNKTLDISNVIIKRILNDIPNPLLKKNARLIIKNVVTDMRYLNRHNELNSNINKTMILIPGDTKYTIFSYFITTDRSTAITK
jgi:hypothetical protein